MNHAYLTVITYPQGMDDRAARAALLSPAMGVDEATLRMRAAKAPPIILGMYPRDAAQRGADALVRAGGDAFVCTIDDLARLGPTLKIRDMRIGAEGLVLELWRGAPAALDPRDVEIIVRANVGEEVFRKAITTFETGSPIESTAVIAAGPGWGWAIRARREQFLESMHDTQPTPISSHKLDMHVRDGRVFQIDGDKFGYEILGALRGHSDFANVDRTVELLTHLHPDAVVDMYFRLWRPPTGYHRLRVPMMQVNHDDPAFLFYSRWSALLYRHVLGGAQL